MSNRRHGCALQENSCWRLVRNLKGANITGRTFTESKGTAVYGLKKPSELFEVVVTLLVYGCLLQAIVAAYGLDP
jgi:hypothetical protein